MTNSAGYPEFSLGGHDAVNGTSLLHSIYFDTPGVYTRTRAWSLIVTAFDGRELLGVDFGEPLHSLVICGTTHPLEDELLQWHRADSKPPVDEAAGVEAEGVERETAP